MDLDFEQREFDELVLLETCYANLYNAYISGDRTKMESEYLKAIYLPIPGFIERCNIEVGTIFRKNGIYAYHQVHNISEIHALSYLELKLNVEGRLAVILDEIRHKNQFGRSSAYSLLSRVNYTYTPNEVLYAPASDRQLKVSDLLSVVKYATSVAEAIQPDNVYYSRASAAITVFQGIDALLNNRPEDKPISKMLHLATSFLSSVVKSSLTNTEAKREVTISTIMVDLVIDFFCK